MKNRPMQLTLREWRDHLTHPTTLILLAAATGVLALTGPFETGTLMSLPSAVAYWGWMVVATYSAGFLINTRLTSHGWQRFAIGTATISLAVLVIVGMTNLAVFGFLPSGSAAVRFVATTLAICAIVNGVFVQLDRASENAEPARDPALLDRLPLEKRGPLVALSVEDHYVRVRTTKGEEMVLMRLGDAIREVEPCRGVQVHRSHWVALDQVDAARREGDRAILTMHGGFEIPVSRANVAAVRDAGLLPGANRG